MGDSEELRTDTLLFMAVQKSLEEKSLTAFRANLHVDIDKIEAEEWVQLYCMAMWLERWKNRNRAELIASMFADGKG
ncbi:MAG: hypothetical protein HDS41_00635 [Bacteroides sp.]|nr:hypothetical protein [Bacteroides sp.]